MRSNLLKKHVRTALTVELNIRYDWLLHIAEIAPAHVLTLADAREVLGIEEELHTRLIVAIGHDFYPPEGKSKPTMDELRVTLSPFKKSFHAPRATQIIHPCSAAVTKKAEMEKEGVLRFKITITSSIGSVVKKEKVTVDSRSEANIMAQEMIRQLGLKKATYKIS